MQIGRLSQLSGVPKSTIRFYEQKGLLPAAQRTASGYRIYDHSALNRLQVIKLSQSLGFSLDEFTKLLDNQGSWEHQVVLTRLLEKQQEISTLIAQLNNKQKNIAVLIEKLQGNWQSGQCLPQDEINKILDLPE